MVQYADPPLREGEPRSSHCTISGPSHGTHAHTPPSLSSRSLNAGGIVPYIRMDSVPPAVMLPVTPLMSPVMNLHLEGRGGSKYSRAVGILHACQHIIYTYIYNIQRESARERERERERVCV